MGKEIQGINDTSQHLSAWCQTVQPILKSPLPFISPIQLPMHVANSGWSPRMGTSSSAAIFIIWDVMGGEEKSALQI